MIKVFNRRQQRPVPKLPLDHRDIHALCTQLARVRVP
tara:strand:+ start:537 stop:647 length:111 start_codon:yes stop_codon:yes gene_type:complete